MANSIKREQDEREKPENGETETVDHVSSEIEHAQMPSTASVESRVATILQGPPSGQQHSPEHEVVRSAIHGDLARILNGSRVNTLLKSDGSDLPKLIKDMVAVAMSELPESKRAALDLHQFRRIEAFAKIGNGYGVPDIYRVPDPREAMFTLARMALLDKDGPAADFLEKLSEVGSESLKGHIRSARMFAHIDHEHLRSIKEKDWEPQVKAPASHRGCVLEDYRASQLAQGHLDFELESIEAPVVATSVDEQTSAEISAAVYGLYGALGHGESGGDIDAFEKILQRKSKGQRQAIETEFEKIWHHPLESFAQSRFRTDVDRVRAINAIKHDDTRTSDLAGALAVAFTKYQNSYFGSDALTEMRTFLMGCSAEDIKEIGKEFPERLRLAGVKNPMTFEGALASLGQPDKEALETLSKGVENITYQDREKLSSCALDKGDLNMFIETWRCATPEDRARYLAQSNVKEDIYPAFPGSFLDRFSKKGMYVDAGKAIDVLELGFVGVDKKIREASTYLYGDFEQHIDMAIRNMSDRERELFKQGERLVSEQKGEKKLSADELSALKRYQSIHDALATAGEPYEIHRWEDLIATKGSLIAQLAQMNGTLYDGTTDSVMKAIENISEQDFEKLRTDPNYRRKIEEVISSFADGRRDDANSELGRCLDLIDRKCRVESDTSRMKPEDKSMYELGRQLCRAGRPEELSKEQSEAADFYQKRSFASAQIRTKRSIFEVIDDNERFYDNNVPSILDGLSNLRSDEKEQIRLSQAVADGKIDVNSLSSEERARYNAADAFRKRLDERLDGVLDQGIKIMSAGDGLYKTTAHLANNEREVAKAVLERIGRGEDGQQNLIDNLNVHATHIWPDKAQIAHDISQSLANDSSLRELAGRVGSALENKTIESTLLAMDVTERITAERLISAMKQSMGSKLFDEIGSKLLNQALPAADRLYLRNVDNVLLDDIGLMRDVESLSPKERSTLQAMLSDESFQILCEGKTQREVAQLERQHKKFETLFDTLTTNDQRVVRNALRNGMQPEDWLGHHLGISGDGTDEEDVKSVFLKLGDRNAVRVELGSRQELKGRAVTEEMITQEINRRLDNVFAQYAHKYGADLAYALHEELGGEDLATTSPLASKHSENSHDILFAEQKAFFNSLGLGSGFVDMMGYGASTSIGHDALGKSVSAQVLDKTGVDELSAAEARTMRDEVSEATSQMDSTQAALADTTADIAINVACLLATIPSAGTSLAALTASVAAKLGTSIRAAGMLAKLGQASTILKGASTTQKLGSAAVLGGSLKTTFKANVVGNYDVETDGPRDFISGLVDTALNATIPFGKVARSAVGRSVGQISEGLTANTLRAADGTEYSIAGAFLKENFNETLERGLTSIGDNALAAGGKVDDMAIRELAENLVKPGIVNREMVVREVASQMTSRLTKNAEYDRSMTHAAFEAIYAARQGALAGLASSIAHTNPDATVEQILMSLTLGTVAGGGMNLGIALPITLAGRVFQRVSPNANAMPAAVPDASPRTTTTSFFADVPTPTGKTHAVDAPSPVLGSVDDTAVSAVKLKLPAESPLAALSQPDILAATFEPNLDSGPMRGVHKFLEYLRANDFAAAQGMVRGQREIGLNHADGVVTVPYGDFGHPGLLDQLRRKISKFGEFKLNYKRLPGQAEALDSKAIEWLKVEVELPSGNTFYLSDPGNVRMRTGGSITQEERALIDALVNSPQGQAIRVHEAMLCLEEGIIHNAQGGNDENYVSSLTKQFKNSKSEHLRALQSRYIKDVEKYTSHDVSSPGDKPEKLRGALREIDVVAALRQAGLSTQQVKQIFETRHYSGEREYFYRWLEEEYDPSL